MPYRRRYNRKRVMSKRPSRWKIYKQAGSQLWRDVKYLKSVINVEYKNVDNSATAQSPTTTPIFMLLNGVATGTDSTDRTGDSVKFVSILFRVRMILNINTNQTIIRLMIVRDKQPNTAIFTQADLLASTTAILSPINLANGKRFKVMIDRTVKLDTNNEEKSMNIFKKMKLHTRYGTNTNGIASINTNSIYFIIWSDQAAAGTAPLCEWYSRLRFIDN